MRFGDIGGSRQTKGGQLGQATDSFGKIGKVNMITNEGEI